jgi:hypothetical protein
MQPAYASLRSLLRSPQPWDVADRKVYACENPNLVAIAADYWSADYAPLVCTDGMPPPRSDACCRSWPKHERNFAIAVISIGRA